MISGAKRILNVGSGPDPARRLVQLLEGGAWEEVRLDVDPSVQPDVVGSIMDLDTLFEPATFDAIWSSHVIEHLYAHEVYPALRQFHRVLKPDGFALIMCPDIEAVAEHIVKEGLVSIAYMSPSGPIRPLDMLYGHSRSIEAGHHFMAHHTGFTADRLGNLLIEAGFSSINVRPDSFEICALAFMNRADVREIEGELAVAGLDLREQSA